MATLLTLALAALVFCGVFGAVQLALDTAALVLGADDDDDDLDGDEV
jgi:hypothetical protein